MNNAEIGLMVVGVGALAVGGWVIGKKIEGAVFGVKSGIDATLAIPGKVVGAASNAAIAAGNTAEFVASAPTSPEFWKGFLGRSPTVTYTRNVVVSAYTPETQAERDRAARDQADSILAHHTARINAAGNAAARDLGLRAGITPVTVAYEYNYLADGTAANRRFPIATPQPTPYPFPTTDTHDSRWDVGKWANRLTPFGGGIQLGVRAFETGRGMLERMWR